MAQFVKHFFIMLVLQAILIGFVFTTALVFGTSIGDGLLFFLYAVPWMVMLPKGPADASTFAIFFGVLMLAAVYSAVISLGLCLIFGRRNRANNYR